MQCRACMQADCDGFLDMSIGVTTDGKNLYDYFNECTQLQATTVDKLPKTLCLTCTNNLRIAYNFRCGARQADEELKKLLTLQKVDPELIYAPTEQIQDHDECVHDPLAVSECEEQKVCLTEAPMLISETELDIPVDEIKTEVPTEQFFGELEIEQFTKEVPKESIPDGECEEGEDVLRSRRTHLCEFCNGQYTTKNELKQHVFEAHKSEIICMKCPKVYELPSELQLHEKLVHSTESPIQCPCCKEPKLLSRDELVKHFQTKHSTRYLRYFPRMRMRGRGVGDPTPYQCENCKQYFSSVFELADHIKKHAFECPICSMSFTKRSTYWAHLRRIHKQSARSLQSASGIDEELNKPFICSLCSMQFRLKRTFQVHMKRKHNQRHASANSDDEVDKPFECTICKMRFRNQGTFKSHKRRKHKELMDSTDTTITTPTKEKTSSIEGVEDDSEKSELVECSFCHKQIAGIKIKTHEKRHIYELKKRKTYLCSFCPRQFNSGTTVKSHEKKFHLYENRERKECPICEKKVGADYLKYHIESVHAAERKFVCDVCGDSFKSYVLLHSHKLLHKERNFQCTVCQKKFIRTCDLKVHMRTHTGELPYACHLCDRRFRIRVRLNYHLQRHAGIKRKCKECGKEFNHVKQLKIHSYKHTGMPYKCPTCGYGCAQRDVFTRHLLRMHDITMTPDELCAMFKANTGRNPHVKSAEELQMKANITEKEEYSN